MRIPALQERALESTQLYPTISFCCLEMVALRRSPPRACVALVGARRPLRAPRRQARGRDGAALGARGPPGADAPLRLPGDSRQDVAGGCLGDVPDVCVVLVGEFGPFGAARSPYHVDRVVRETGGIAGGGLREVYVSALARDGSDVAALMGAFEEAEVYDETRFPATSGEKRRLRHTKEGRGT